MYQDATIILLPVLDAAVIAAACLAARRCREVRGLQVFWLLVALAWSAQLCADSLLVLYDVVLAEPRFPSAADAFFLAFYPLLLLALLRVPVRSRARSERLRTALDCALIVVGGATAVWYFVLGPTLTEGSDDLLATAVSIAYPVGDIVALAALAAIVLRRTDPRLGTPLVWIASGLTLLIAADTVYGYELLHGNYTPGGPVDVFYMLVTVPFFLAAMSQRAVSAGAVDPPSEWREASIASPLPYIGMAVGFSFLLTIEWGDRFFPDFSLLLFAFAVVVLGTLRQLLTQREQRRMAEALRESESLFRGIYTNTGIGIAISAFEGGRPRIIDVNPAFARMMGYSPEELRGGDFSMLTPPEHLDSLEQISEAIRSGADVVDREQPSLRKDGSIAYGSLTVSVMRDEAGLPRMLVGAIGDITERKAAERAKDEFISIVGHELRTPLTAIRGSLGLLQGGITGEVSGDAKGMIDTAVASTDRLVRLINDVLDLERMESGRIQLRMGPVTARELVDQSLDVVGTIAEAAEIELCAEVPDLYVEADSDRIVQTLTNLLANAIKFSHPGQGVKVSVDRDGDRARFSVLDHGRGIPADQLTSIFERFGQVDASDAREKGGTGLGLAIAQQIVEGHGGQIWAESGPDYGTRIQFTLPAAAAPAEVPG
ncbi:MAG TPA: ATP-binding protein [Solirubrobacterales bacterium]|nr:ATP-binding protein [Solirubrobacterales bacterium]